MRVDVRLILLSYHRLYLVACTSPSVLIPFVGVGDLVHLLSVYRAGGGFNIEPFTKVQIQYASLLSR